VNADKANVLLVDEHPDDLLALETALGELGQPVVKAHSGQEALRLLQSQDFAVVLLAVQLSGLDGFETARQIHAQPRSRHTPIIFLADQDDRPSLERAYSLGAVDYLVKPLLPVVLRAKVAGFVDLFHKTEHVKRKLAEENARFRALTEHSSDAVTLVGPDGTVLYNSPSSQRVLGYEPGEFLGRSGFEVVHPDDQERARTLLAQLVRQPESPVTAEMRVRHQDGSWLWMECVGTNLLGEPAVGAVVVNYRDISERHRASQALRQSEERFRQLAEHIREVFWMSDPHKTEMLYISPA
jgi:PAS domain S-box-containing protein